MENPDTIKLDDRFVYSASGKAYPRRRPRSPKEVEMRRLPYIKATLAKGRMYNYFTGHSEGPDVRLPAFEDPGFDHAYLCELARLEGSPKPEYQRNSSVVYFVGADTGQIKIGYAFNVRERLIGLQCGSPVKLRILATVLGRKKIERDYHRQFAEHRLHGEWFAPHPDILAEIERLGGRHGQD